MIITNIIISCLILLAEGCSSTDGTHQPGTDTGQKSTITSANISTDKACYSPGSTVSFTLDTLPSSAYVRYYHLGNELSSDEVLTSKQWTWTPPSTDYTGYMAEIYTKDNDGTEKMLGSIGVDVSSDWKRFPRYGFLSAFGDMKGSQIQSVVASLNRYHLNGIQFYDWQYEHHQPLAGTPASPALYWTDIARRSTSSETVKNYISALHNRGMMAMFYNLCFGALSDASSDGVDESWYLFKDKTHSVKDCLELPSSMFKSNIYIVNPGNSNWQRYLAARNADVYSVYDFDGYHIDQLGSRGNVYDYNGISIDLPTQYASFIQYIKNAAPSKKLVMNAVSRFGSENIATTDDVDFLYNELWDSDASFSSIKDVIDQNSSYDNGKLKTVFAAYMDYNKADNAGYFNTPGVLLTDAVMFALGGDHLEMGEHMLCKEYFPNNNLQMDATLKSGIVGYYDFMTAYENLLRDGGTFNSVDMSCTNGKMSIAAWPPSTGNVTVIARKINDNIQVVHLINSAKADVLSWRDFNGTMPEPSLIASPSFQMKVSGTVNRIWYASPDINSGVCQELSFNKSGSSVSFTLPSLKYWDMIVVEYK